MKKPINQFGSFSVPRPPVMEEAPVSGIAGRIMRHFDDLDYKVYEVGGNQGEPHWIDTETVISLITMANDMDMSIINRGFEFAERKGIDKHKYLTFLGECYIQNGRFRMDLEQVAQKLLAEDIHPPMVVQVKIQKVREKRVSAIMEVDYGQIENRVLAMIIDEDNPFH